MSLLWGGLRIMIKLQIYKKGDETNKNSKPIQEALNKTIRLIRSTEGITLGRKGKCTPTKCSTLDGKKGAACCKLGYTCPLLKTDRCTIYPIRPPNCHIFPRTPADLKLVKGCGYYWSK